MTSPQKLQSRGQLLSEGITQNPVNYASCPQVTPGSHLLDSLLWPLSHCVPKNQGCLFYYLLSCLKTVAILSALLGSCSLSKPVSPIFSGLSLFLK